MSYKAFLFDLNGTMIDDMEYHVTAWSSLLNEDLNAGLKYGEVKKQMYGKNSEVLTRIFGEGRFTWEEMEALSIEKEKRYQLSYKPHLTLIKGLHSFMDKARAQHIEMAIGSAAIPFNIDFVLDNLDLRDYFSVIVSAEDVNISKPHPETYLKAAELLELAPEDCLVFEDAPKGVEAAQRAGMNCVVLTTMHREDEFSQYGNIVLFTRDYTDARLGKWLV